ncbi:hypothetical protein CsSME_00027410 [Camellia sinensis var. sinensis]
MPGLARRLGIKSVHYCIISPARIGYTLTPERQLLGRELTQEDLMEPPAGYPLHSIKLNPHESRAFAAIDAMQFEPPTSPLEEKWAKWLAQFELGSVIYCAFGNSVQAALPKKFETPVEQRGIVHGGWVQQQLILEHSSMGCFITHCGSGSLSEALVNTCQLVLLPNVGDRIINARMMSTNLKVGVEVEKGEDGLFTRESVCKAVRVVMDEESELGKEVKENHGKMKEFSLNKDLESFYIDNFNKKLHGLLG